MFLNLKNKKVIDAALNNHIKANQYPKTYREEPASRISKESLEQHTNHNHHRINKKQTSTALNQETNFNKTKNSTQSLESESKAQMRGQKVANVYKKLKNYDIVDKSRQSQESLEIEKQKNHKSTKCFPRNVTRKQAIATLTNNYIKISENDKKIQKHQEKQQSSEDSKVNELLYLLLSVFNQQQSKTKEETIGLNARSHTSRQVEIKSSLQRNPPKFITKNSFKNLSKRNKTSRNGKEQTVENIFYLFQQNIQQIDTKIQEQSKLMKNDHDRQSLQLVQKIMYQMQKFSRLVYEKVIGQTQVLLRKYEKSLQQVCKSTMEYEEKCYQLQRQRDSLKQYSSNLQGYINQANMKNYYASSFFNEIAYHFDIDTFIHQKIIACHTWNQNGENIQQSQSKEGSLYQFIQYKQKNKPEQHTYLQSDILHPKTAYLKGME